MYGQGSGRGPSRGFGGQNRFSPVRVGEELDVTIEAVGEKGDGIAKKQGFVLFIPGAKEGQNVKVRVTKVLRKVGFAEVIGEGAAPAPEQSGAGAEAPQEMSQEAPSEEPSLEDTEDFGEEPEGEEEKPEEAGESEEAEPEEAPEEEPKEE